MHPVPRRSLVRLDEKSVTGLWDATQLESDDESSAMPVERQFADPDDASSISTTYGMQLLMTADNTATLREVGTWEDDDFDPPPTWFASWTTTGTWTALSDTSAYVDLPATGENVALTGDCVAEEPGALACDFLTEDNDPIRIDFAL